MSSNSGEFVAGLPAKRLSEVSATDTPPAAVAKPSPATPSSNPAVAKQDFKPVGPDTQCMLAQSSKEALGEGNSLDELAMQRALTATWPDTLPSAVPAGQVSPEPRLSPPSKTSRESSTPPPSQSPKGLGNKGKGCGKPRPSPRKLGFVPAATLVASRGSMVKAPAAEPKLEGYWRSSCFNPGT